MNSRRFIRSPRRRGRAAQATRRARAPSAGYAAGLGTRTSRLPVYLMGLVVCAVILLIADIDTPFTGFISISQQPLVDTAISIEALSRPD